MRVKIFLVLAVFLASVAFMNVPAFAEEEAAVHIVEMLNKGDEGVMVFKPAVVFASVGDTVRFVPTTKMHNAETFPDMIPEGGTAFVTKINEEAEVVVDAEGVWGYFCKPHKGMGMVGLIVVGETDITSTVVSPKAPSLAKKRFKMYVEEVEKFSAAAE